MTTEKNGQAVQAKSGLALSEMIGGNLVVMREVIKDRQGKEKLTADGRKLFKYFVRGAFRNRTIEAQFDPKDVGGYEPLDILFEMPNKPVLIMTDEVMDNDGKKTYYTSYKVQAADESGEVFECGVKPHGDGNKALLKMILSGIQKTA